MKKLLMFMVAGNIVFGACKKDEDPVPTPTSDTTKPIATISSPVGGSSLKAGDNFVITAKVTDETNLKSYNLKLMSGANAVRDTTIVVSGKEAAVNMTMNTTGMAGAHSVSLTATDAAGNVSTEVTSAVTIVAGDTEKPKIKAIVVKLPFGTKLDKGFPNQLEVEASDNEGLSSYTIELWNKEGGKEMIKTITVLKKDMSDPKLYKDSKLIFEFPDNSFSLNNAAEFRIKAIDDAGNEATLVQPITIQ